jgi:zeta-carotene desaturase
MRVLIAGGGLAGMAAAAALGSAGFEVDLFEARPFLGGRATAYSIPGAEEVIDNCQHILLRCCVNLLDFYRRLGVEQHIRFYREYYFVEPGGRVSRLGRSSGLPAPLHFAPAFARVRFLSLSEKVALGRGFLALLGQRRRQDLDDISMHQWLAECGQPERLIERFWRQVLVSALNEELTHMAASHAFQVFWLGFLCRPDSYEMGIPAVPLAELYAEGNWRGLPNVRIHLRCPVERISREGVFVGGREEQADFYVSAVPFEKLTAVVPELQAPPLGHSPITGIHLWFDRAVTDLPHATLLDREIQWMFNKRAGRYIQLVVSASRRLATMTREQIIQLAVEELAEFFPAVREARLTRAHVVKELRATFSAAPGTGCLRPPAETAIPNLFLAGDWTQTGWPATMEGAVRSGYLAAEAICRRAGRPVRFLLPDIDQPVR